jgi:hypothetical protein
MEVTEIIAEIDKEIARLQQARELLSGGGGGVPSPFSQRTRKKRVLSPEARERIAEAQKKRWAKQKAAAKAK